MIDPFIAAVAAGYAVFLLTGVTLGLRAALARARRPAPPGRAAPAGQAVRQPDG